MVEKHNIIHKRGIIMTKKRFVGLFQGDMLVSVKDTQTNERVNIIQIITLANILYAENEYLKQEIQEQKQIIAKQEMKLAEYNNQK